MYIVELFVKWLNKNKRREKTNPGNIYQEGVSYNEEGELTRDVVDEAEFCKHNFMPVDSTGNVLACTKCGFLIKKR